MFGSVLVFIYCLKNNTKHIDDKKLIMMMMMMIIIIIIIIGSITGDEGIQQKLTG